MRVTSFSLVSAGALLFALPSSATTQDGPAYSVRNDTGRQLVCGVRRAGSSAIDSFTLRAGDTWTRSFSGSKTRLIMCEGILSRWQPLTPGQSYRLVTPGDDRVVAQPLPR